MTISAEHALAFKTRSELLRNNFPKTESDLVETILLFAQEISTMQNELNEIEGAVNNIMDCCHPNNHHVTVLKQDESSEIKQLESMTLELVDRVESLCGVKNMHSANQAIYLTQIYKVEQYLSGELDYEGITPSEHLLEIETELQILLSKIKTIAIQNIDAGYDDLKRQIHWAKLRGEEIANNIRQFLSNNLLDISVIEIAS